MTRFTLDWIQLAAAVGALQGVLLAAVLVRQQVNRTANRLLAALVLTFTLYLASSVIHSTALIRELPHAFGIGYQMPWLFGPLVYLYAVAASDRSRRFRPADWLHFLPFATSIILTAPYYFLSGSEKLALFDRIIAGEPLERVVWIDPFKYVSGVAYSAATLWYLRLHARRIEASYSNIARVNLSWLTWLTGGAVSIWLMATLLGVPFVGAVIRDEHVTLAIAVLAYAIGYRGLRQPEVFRFETSEFEVPAAPAALESSIARTAYAKPALDDTAARHMLARLEALMRDGSPWKSEDLTLADLAGKLDTTPHKLSELLNQHVGTTFYDFVNGYRVRDVQRRIRAGDADRLKMLALALDAGFASKSSFNDVFKKHVGRTPSEYRRSLDDAAPGEYP